MQDKTELNVHWGQDVGAWVFTATRDNMVWQWTVSVEDFKLMIDAMSDMDDELTCSLGSQQRNGINRRDN